MKRLEISRLMDEYTDTEFFPNGGSAVSPETVKGRVLAGAKAPAKKKQLPRKKRLLLAAALAAVLVLLAGAGFPYLEHQLVSGKLIFEQTSDGRITGLVHYGSPVEAEDGRLFLNRNDDQRLDITDLISEDIPYLYDGSDPDTGMIYYLIVGGTPDHCSYLEWMTASTPFGHDGDPTAGAHGARTATVYAFERVPRSEEQYAFGEGTGFDMPVQVYDWMAQPWLLTALNELGIPFEYASEPENDGSYILK